MAGFQEFEVTQPPMHPADREMIARGFALLYAAYRMPFAPLGEALDHADWIAGYVSGQLSETTRQFIRDYVPPAGRGGP